ncbi:DUF3375 family protein [Saccharopolyspora shandongensis]|uniref:DUF3375 family protein n=1 Tax=Saccharopolyspora shandongensis TaxID=418495 RepID=UPI0033EACCC4
MTDQDAERLFHEFRSNADTDVTMSLLRSNDALLHLTLMAAHLGDGQVVEGETLTARIEEDLPRLLRSYPQSEDEALIAFPDADTLLTRWTKKGWVRRTIAPDTRIERYQLTSGAAQAVRQMRNVRRRFSVATESALAMVMAEIRQVAAEANPDVEARRAALDEQIAFLTEQRAALDRDEPPEINHGELIDKVSALVQLTDRMPGDIARYGEHMQANTAELIRRTFSDDPAEFADSLEKMFDGHDLINESPEGLAFRAFATLISTPSQRSQLESDIADILRHVERLPADLAESLSGFIDAMWTRVRDVEEARGVAFRRIHAFVRGGDAMHYQSMRTRISEAQAAAIDAFKHTHGGRDIGFTVPMSGVETASVGRLRLDEGTSDTPAPLITEPDPPVDMAALLGRESIHWAALRAAVNTALQSTGYATLPEVLGRLDQPRAGDVIGLWSLATQHGQLDTNARTTVTAYTGRGLREIILPFLLFGEPIPDPVAPTSRSSAVRPLRAQNVFLEKPDA